MFSIGGQAVRRRSYRLSLVSIDSSLSRNFRQPACPGSTCIYMYIYYIDGCHGYLPSITPKGIHGFVFDLSIFGSFFGTSNILGRCVQTSVFLRQAMPVSGFKSVGWLMIMHKGCTTYITLAIINIIIHHHNITIHNIYIYV